VLLFLTLKIKFKLFHQLNLERAMKLIIKLYQTKLSTYYDNISISIA